MRCGCDNVDPISSIIALWPTLLRAASRRPRQLSRDWRGASAPELEDIIGHHAGINDDAAAKAIAHAILGGVTAALQGNSAAAGAVGAVSGELIATAIARQLYPDTDPSTLTEEQKQTVSTLASVSAGIAGGLAGEIRLVRRPGPVQGRIVLRIIYSAVVKRLRQRGYASTASIWRPVPIIRVGPHVRKQ
jgi:hypothetical protein